jgi:hypothetical protein
MVKAFKESREKDVERLTSDRRREPSCISVRYWTQGSRSSTSVQHTSTDVEMTGEGEDLGDPSPDEDDFEKQMRLVNESDKTTVRSSQSQTQVYQLEGWISEKPIPYISNDNFSQEGIFDYWNGKL